MLDVSLLAWPSLLKGTHGTISLTFVRALKPIFLFKINVDPNNDLEYVTLGVAWKGSAAVSLFNQR